MNMNMYNTLEQQELLEQQEMQRQEAAQRRLAEALSQSADRWQETLRTIPMPRMLVWFGLAFFMALLNSGLVFMAGSFRLRRRITSIPEIPGNPISTSTT